MKIRYAGDVPCERRAWQKDRWADRYNEANNRFSQFCEPA